MKSISMMTRNVSAFSFAATLLGVAFMTVQVFSQETPVNPVVSEDPLQLFEPREFQGDNGKVLRYDCSSRWGTTRTRSIRW